MPQSVPHFLKLIFLANTVICPFLLCQVDKILTELLVWIGIISKFWRLGCVDGEIILVKIRVILFF